MRLTLNAAGQPTTAHTYDAWGVPTAGTPQPFGFTGELQSSATGLQYLRARWYNPAMGTLLGRDPFDGYPNQPYSLHPYQYGYSQPTLHSDPSGQVSEETATDIVECVVGAGNAWAQDNLPYVPAEQTVEGNPNYTEVGRTCGMVGHAAAFVQGIAEIVGGFGAGAAGLAECVTVIFCPVGVVTVVAGGALVLHGGMTATKGFVGVVTGCWDGFLGFVTRAADGGAGIVQRMSTEGGTGSTDVPKVDSPDSSPKTIIDPRKIEDYMFGRATGRGHNIERTKQNLGQMQRIGIPDDPSGHALLMEHFESVPNQNNVIHTFINYGKNNEVRESLLVGPGGIVKFESTWEIQPNGDRRLTTIIPMGNGPYINK